MEVKDKGAEGAPEDKDKGTAGASGAGGAPAGDKKPEHQDGGAKGAAGGDGKGPYTPKDDEEEIPTSVELLQLTPKAMESRLRRYNKRQLKELFGTDDPEQIKAGQAELRALREEKETTRKAKLSAEEKAKEERAALEQRASAAETRAQMVEDERTIERATNRIDVVARKYLDPDYIEDQYKPLAKHLKKAFSSAEMRKLPDSALEEFFEKLVERKPKLAKDYEAGAAAKGKDGDEGKDEKKDSTRRVPANNGTSGNPPREAKSGGAGAPKNYSPRSGMSSAEARKKAAEEGLRWGS